MTIKVVQGLVGLSKTDSGVGQTSLQNSSNIVNVVTSASQVQPRAQDAALTSIRAQRTSDSVRIRDAGEAKEVAKEVAEKIKESDDPESAHSSLTPVSAREHFV